MTDNLKCPFCGAELLGSLNEKYCTNRECEHYMRTIPTSIWQALIDGKKAQRQLRTIKDHCVKKLKAKEREIASYLNGISVRQSKNEKLAKQLKQAQDALVEIKSILESARYADTLNFSLDNADGRQIYEIITSITKQEYNNYEQ